MKKLLPIIYSTCVVAMLAALFVCTIFMPTISTEENRTLAEIPQFVTSDCTLNTNYLSEWGTYYTDHYAFKNNLVDADSRIRESVFGVSSSTQVVTGTDGWLYYSGDLPGHLRRSETSEAEARNIAYNLSLVQNYVEGYGSEFLFTIAPDKSSIYPEHYPYYYVAADNESLRERVEGFLAEYDVNYLNLFTVIEQNRDNNLYYQRDSHWNNTGAALASEEILRRFDIVSDFQLNSSGEVDDHSGDLDGMVHPISLQAEQTTSYSLSEWEMTKTITAANDGHYSLAEAECPTGDARTLLMFRDSFGMAVLPFMASSFSKSAYEWLMPYNITDMVKYDADCVVLERVERELGSLAIDPPIMSAVETIAPDDAVLQDSLTTVDAKSDGDFTVISGILDTEYVSDDSTIIVNITSDDGEYDSSFLPFRTTIVDGNGASITDFGYKMYAITGSLPLSYTVTVFAVNGEGAVQLT